MPGLAIFLVHDSDVCHSPPGDRGVPETGGESWGHRHCGRSSPEKQLVRDSFGCLWRDRVRLPRFWRKAFSVLEIVGPITIAVLAVPAIDKMLGDKWATKTTLAAAGVTILAVMILRLDEILRTDAKRFVDIILDALGNEVYSRAQGPREQHRITLFQSRRRFGFLPRRFWEQLHHTHVLVPRTRVPASGRRPLRTFAVNHHREEHCEGVAGVIYAHGTQTVSVCDLPDIGGNRVPSERDFENFARMTRDTVENVKKERYYMRSIGGTTIYVRGDRWGVLLFDSSDPRIMKAALSSKAAAKALQVLTGIIEMEEL